MFNDNDRGATFCFKLYALFITYVAGAHFVALLLPGLCGRMLYSFAPLPSFLGSHDDVYVTALTHRLCNSATLREFLPLLLQGTMHTDSDIGDAESQEQYRVLIQHALGGLEHLLVGYVALTALGVLVCYVGKRSDGLPSSRPSKPAAPRIVSNSEGIHAFFMLAMMIGLPLTVWRLASSSLRTVLPAELQYATCFIVVYLLVVLAVLGVVGVELRPIFQPAFLQHCTEQLCLGRGDTSFKALACEVTTIVCTVLFLLSAVFLVPLHYGHYLCPLSGPLQLQFGLPSFTGAAASVQLLMPLLLQVPLVGGFTALLKRYLAWSFRAAGLSSALVTAPPRRAAARRRAPVPAVPAHVPRPAPPPAGQSVPSATHDLTTVPGVSLLLKLIPIVAGGLLLLCLYSTWVQRAPLVVGRWATFCLCAILSRGYNSQAPDWESDLVAYPIGLYLCSLFAQYLCAMLTEVAIAVQSTLVQHSDAARTWSTTLRTTLSAALTPLWLWLRQGVKVVFAFALWLPCVSILPGMLADLVVHSFVAAEPNQVAVHDASFAATRMGYCLAKGALA
jgi:hypothetical protein